MTWVCEAPAAMPWANRLPKGAKCLNLLDESETECDACGSPRCTKEATTACRQGSECGLRPCGLCSNEEVPK